MTNAAAANSTGNTAVTPQGAAVAPASTRATTKASPRKGAPKAARGGRPAAAKTAPATRKAEATKPAKATAAKARMPEARDGSKKSAVLDLLRRKDGATAAEIAKSTKWQPHTIRGFISGTISKKMKLAVESVRNEKGERVYKVK
jgi:hypothetical protein